MRSEVRGASSRATTLPVNATKTDLLAPSAMDRASKPSRPDHGSRRIARKRIALVVTVLLSDLLFAGVIWGWAPLLLMLQEEQQYAELCDFDDVDVASSARTCVAQENQLNLVYAVAVVVMCAMSLPIGLFLDSAGPKVTSAFAGLFTVTGMLLLAFADSQHFDVFLPAYTLLGFGGSLTLLSSFPVSFAVVEYQTAILAAVNCLFDGSCAVFLVLYAIRANVDVTRQQLLCALSVVAGVNYVALVVLWHVNEHELRGVRVTDSRITEQESLCGSSATAPESEHPVSTSEAIVVKPAVNPVGYGSAKTHDAEDDQSALRKESEIEDGECQLVDVSICRQMQSLEFAFIVVFGAVQMLRANIYIGTTNILLENYGDQMHGFLFTKVFSIVLPLGFVFVPVVDHVMTHKGLAFSLFFTNVLGAVYNILSLIRNLYVQCLTFVVFTGFRVFVFTVLSVYTAKTFGLNNMGSLMGMIFALGAIVNLAEYPAVYLSNAYFDGDLTVVYGITLAMCGLLFPYTEWERQRKRAREQKQHG